MTVSGAKKLNFSRLNLQKQPMQREKLSKVVNAINQNASGPASPKTLFQDCEGYNKCSPKVFKLKSPKFSPTSTFSKNYSWLPL